MKSNIELYLYGKNDHVFQNIILNVKKVIQFKKRLNIIK